MIQSYNTFKIIYQMREKNIFIQRTKWIMITLKVNFIGKYSRNYWNKRQINQMAKWLRNKIKQIHTLITWLVLTHLVCKDQTILRLMKIVIISLIRKIKLKFISTSDIVIKMKFPRKIISFLPLSRNLSAR